jgi:hypothetical protein
MRRPICLTAVAWVSGLVLALALAGACGGPSFDGAVYRGDGFAFRVGPVPSGWTRIPASHASLAFRDEQHDATIALTGRCGLDGEDVPLASLTQHLFIQFTGREILEQQVVPFDQREAMHTVLSAKLDGVLKKFDVWVMKKDGCVYDLYYIAAPARFDAGVSLFRSFVESFATVSADDSAD